MRFLVLALCGGLFSIPGEGLATPRQPARGAPQKQGSWKLLKNAHQTKRLLNKSQRGIFRRLVRARRTPEQKIVESAARKLQHAHRAHRFASRSREGYEVLGDKGTTILGEHGVLTLGAASLGRGEWLVLTQNGKWMIAEPMRDYGYMLTAASRLNLAVGKETRAFRRPEGPTAEYDEAIQTARAFAAGTLKETVLIRAETATRRVLLHREGIIPPD